MLHAYQALVPFSTRIDFNRGCYSWHGAFGMTTQKNLFLRLTKFCPPKKFVNWRHWVTDGLDSTSSIWDVLKVFGLTSAKLPIVRYSKMTFDIQTRQLWRSINLKIETYNTSYLHCLHDTCSYPKTMLSPHLIPHSWGLKPHFSTKTLYILLSVAADAQFESRNLQNL